MGEYAIRSIPDLFYWAASEEIDEGLFSEASQTILSIVRAFEYESKLESSLSICLNGLSYEDYIVFTKGLVKEIELIQKLIDHFDRPDQAERVSRFTVFLSDALRHKAESLLRLKKWKDAIKVLKEVLELRPKDQDIRDRIEALEKEINSEGADSSEEVKEQSEDEFVNLKFKEARTLERVGKLSEAIECLEDALVVKPDDKLLKAFHKMFVKQIENKDSKGEIFKRMTSAEKLIYKRKFIEEFNLGEKEGELVGIVKSDLESEKKVKSD